MAVVLVGVTACGSSKKLTPGTQTTVAVTSTAAPSTTGSQATVVPTTLLPRPTTTATPATTAATTLISRPTTTAAQTVSYASCAEARAAGAAPLHRGDPGYSSKLDRDGDGVACEPCS